MAPSVLEIKPQEREVRKSTPNLLPCRIHHTGPVESSEQFWSPSEDKDGKKSAYFRGRKLQGRSIKVPAGYRGVIVEKSEPLSNGSRQLEYPEDVETEQAEPESQVETGAIDTTAEFDEVIVWGHGAAVEAATDPYIRGMEEWLAVSEQIHSCPSKNEAS